MKRGSLGTDTCRGPYKTRMRNGVTFPQPWDVVATSLRLRGLAGQSLQPQGESACGTWFCTSGPEPGQSDVLCCQLWPQDAHPPSLSPGPGHPPSLSSPALILVSFSAGSSSRGERGLCLGALRTLVVAFPKERKGARKDIGMAVPPRPA